MITILLKEMKHNSLALKHLGTWHLFS